MIRRISQYRDHPRLVVVTMEPKRNSLTVYYGDGVYYSNHRSIERLGEIEAMLTRLKEWYHLTCIWAESGRWHYGHIRRPPYVIRAPKRSKNK